MKNMIKLVNIIAISLFVLIGTFGAQAYAVQSNDNHETSASNALDAKLSKINRMQADFIQTISSPKSTPQVTKGMIAIAKPNRFRWVAYATNGKHQPVEIIVSDGTKIWNYDVDLEQVTVQSVKKQLAKTNTPANLLSGDSSKLADLYTITANSSHQQYTLTAKQTDQNIKKIELIFSGDQLSNMKFYDKLNQVISVDFSNIKNNPKISADVFKLKKLPKDVDIIQQ